MSVKIRTVTPYGECIAVFADDEQVPNLAYEGDEAAIKYIGAEIAQGIGVKGFALSQDAISPVEYCLFFSREEASVFVEVPTELLLEMNEVYFENAADQEEQW